MQAGILAVAGIIVRIIGLLYNTPLTNIIGDEGLDTTAMPIRHTVSSFWFLPIVFRQPYRRSSHRSSPKENIGNAHRIFQCALIYVLVVGGIASLFVFFFASYMVDLGGSVLPLRILAPTIFFSGILGVFRGYFQAHKSMVQTSVSADFGADCECRSQCPDGISPRPDGKGREWNHTGFLRRSRRHDWYGGRCRFCFAFYDGRVCAQ